MSRRMKTAKLTRSLRQRGLSLIELMVAMTLGLFLLLGVATTFLAAREASTLEGSLSRLQGGASAAVELVGTDLRRAGYYACNSIGGQVEVAATGVQAVGLQAYTRPLGTSDIKPDTTFTAVDILEGVARPGSDILVVDYGEHLGDDLIYSPIDGRLGTSLTVQLSSKTIPATPAVPGLPGQPATPAVPAKPGSNSGKECRIQEDDLVLVSNCLTAHVFRASSASSCGSDGITVAFDAAENAQTTPNASFNYQPGSDVAELVQVMWYVADTGRRINGQPVFSLFRLLSNQTLNAAQEVVEGVEFLKVEVGERSGAALNFIPADNIAAMAAVDWSKVESVRFGLLVQGFDTVRDDSDEATYQVLGAEVGPNSTLKHNGGRVVRRVYTSTQVVRNRNYGI